MDDRLKHIVSTLDGIESVEDETELGRLETAIDNLINSGQAEIGMGALFRIFERFPDKDGFGIFWSILRVLESLSGYESALVKSVQSCPSEFSLLMVNRILNAGKRYVRGTDLLALLQEAARNPSAPESVRAEAREFIEFQRTSHQL